MAYKAERYRIGNIANLTDYTCEDPEILQEALTVDELDLSATLKACTEMFESFDTERQAIKEICDLYRKTTQGNKRYGTSETAIKEKEKLENIETELANINKGVNYINENFDSEGKITKYNENLRRIKRYAKRKLLEIEAKKVNAAAENGTSKYLISSSSFSKNNKPYNYVDGSTYVYYIITTRPTSRTVGNGRTVYDGDFKGTKKIFRYFNSSYIKPISWSAVTDGDVQDLEARFHANHIPLPY